MNSSSHSALEDHSPANLPSSIDKTSIAIHIEKFSFFYKDHQALNNISFPIQRKEITAIIGPSGCGKSTLIRCINRMNDHIVGIRYSGDILLDGKSIYAPDCQIINLRRRVGMVFQRWNPFPKSIFENIVYGLRIVGIRNKSILQETVERSLRSAALWDEVKDRLHSPALSLSGGQQQRLCIARTIATQPEIILMDEPCSALDPVSTMQIEQLMNELKAHFTLVVVTHNLQQAMRVSNHTAFIAQGELVEFDSTQTIFTSPKNPQTEAFVTGRYR